MADSSDADSIGAELKAAGERLLVGTGKQSEKKNYAERLSRGLAQKFANGLRPTRGFDAILPNPAGSRHESRVRSAKGYKKLDVNYSTVELGLGLGVSIKTINFRDPTTGRYTKNYTRVDGELRAEASDYHVRQPYAVMVAVIFLPLDACDDGSDQTPSSFGQAIQIFRFRSGRLDPEHDPMLFEKILVGLYDTSERTFGDLAFFDVAMPPPRRGRPQSLLTFSQACQSIVETYDARNSPRFVWADAAPEKVTAPIEEDGEET